MTLNRYVTFFTGLAILCLFAMPAWAIDTDGKVEQILIEGNNRVQEPTIRYYISLEPGEYYSAVKVRNDIKNLYALGYFDDIRVEARDGEKGLLLSYIFREKPFVVNVVVKGMDEVTSKDIFEKIELKKGQHLKRNLILKDIIAIKKLYKEKGFYFVDVNVVEKDRGSNRVAVEFNIDEGSKIYVRDIRFFGNKEFTNQDLLSTMETTTKGIFSGLSDSGTYKLDVLKTDVLRIETLYRNNGFIRFRVEDPRVEIDREIGKIYITFFINEGEKYRVGDIKVEGDDLFSGKKLKETLGLKKGDIFDRSKFAKGIFEVTNLYLVKGYAFADVIQRTNINDKEKIVDIDLEVDRGQKIYIGNLNIYGNEKTIDKVIRREFRFKEGELFDVAKLRRSKERLDRLGFFETVDIKQKGRQEDELIDLDINVTETNTGTLSMGAGYSSIEKAMFFASVKQRNLFGRGQQLSFNAEFSDLKTDFTIDFKEPYLFDKELSGGVSIFNNNTSYIDYKTDNKGGGLRVGKSLGEYSWGNISYKYKVTKTEIDNAEDGSPYLLASEGLWRTHTATPSLSRDTRNDYFSPTKGSKFSLIGAFSTGDGPNGNIQYYRLNVENGHYVPLFWDFIFFVHAKTGYANTFSGEELPIFENYRLGGPSSLRGYTFDDIGPRDINGKSVGGKALLMFNLELHYPFSRYVRGLLFYDMGQVYGEDIYHFDHPNRDQYVPARTSATNYDLYNLRQSWGVGVRFFSPMGPISLAWGFKTDPLDGESDMEFHFNVGGNF